MPKFQIFKMETFAKWRGEISTENFKFLEIKFSLKFGGKISTQTTVFTKYIKYNNN